MVAARLAGLCAIVALWAGGCAAPSTSVQGNGPKLVGPTAPPDNPAALPPIPQDAPADSAAIAVRNSSLKVTCILDGDTYSDRAPSAVADLFAHTLRLKSAAKTSSWGMYAFDGVLSTDSPFVLTIELTASLPAEYYIGVADYVRGCWYWQAVSTPNGEDSLTVPLTVNPVSAGSRLYAAVVAYGGEKAVVRRAKLYLQTAAPPPSGLHASDGTSGSTIALSWTDPAVRYPGLSYDAVVIERANAAGGPWAALNEVPSGTTAYNDVHDGACNLIRYNWPVFYRLRTRVGVVTGPPGLADSGLRVLATVTGLTATQGDYPDKIALAWSAVSSADGYQIEYRSDVSPFEWTPLATVPGTSFQHTATAPPGCEVLDSVIYSYHVRAAYLGDVSPDLSNEAQGFRNEPPIAALTATPDSGNGPLSVTCDASASSDPNGGHIVLYEWDWDGDGVYDESGTDPKPAHLYGRLGVTHPAVRVTDFLGRTDAASTTVTVLGWVHTWGTDTADEANATAVDSAGDLYMAGDTGYDALAVKFSPQGDVRWAASLDLEGGYDTLQAAAVGPLGDLYAVGYTSVSDNENTLLVKLSPDGTLAWGKTWDSGDRDFASGVAVDSTGNVFVAGYITPTGSGDTDLLLLRYDDAGGLVWQKTWGGDDRDEASSIVLHGGDVHLSGSTTPAGGDHTAGLYLVYDGSGAVSTAKSWSVPGTDAFLGNMALASDGTAYLAGNLNPLPSSFNIGVIRVSPAGDLEWQRAWGLGLGSSASASGLVLSGEWLYIGGGTWRTKAGALLMKYDTAGNLQYAKSWAAPGTLCRAMDISLDAAGELSLGGTAEHVQGEWGYEPGGAELSVSGTWQDAAGTEADVTGTAKDVVPTIAYLTGVMDTGGGDGDVLAIRYDPAFD